MFYFLSLLTGVLVTIMVAVNGRLTGFYGLYSATVMIHIVGLILISLVVLFKRENPFAKRYSWFLYLGGAIGVVTTVSNNLAFGRISVSALLALGLLGQSISGIIIDQYGLFGMPKHLFTRRKLIGLTLIIAGIVSMITDFEPVAVTVSFISGISIVASRTVNAKLADVTSVRISSFFNYVVGLAVAAIVFLILGRGEIVREEFVFAPYWYIYLGGALGLAAVWILNVVTVKISAFYLTLLLFIGQVFSGVIIDIFLSGEISSRNLIGGVLVAVGLSINLLLERKEKEVQ
ncbi:MAG: DMT family transporter [Defluviitaleaceae bacterium]|nr:DMT family transporter [Defluviitaleaceae bacterium]